MSGAAADRNLLVGIIALQLDFITRDALISAMNSWIVNKEMPLSQILLDQGELSSSRRSLLDALVAEHLTLHDGSAEKSLAAVSSIGSLHAQLSQIADPDLQASLPRVWSTRPEPRSDEDPMRTEGGNVGEPMPGTRFRILRPHAKGGLGQVWVALDTELDRPVALKEIQDRHADDPGSRSRFMAEAEITGKLEHPGIVPVYGLGRYSDGRPFYAMRFIQGNSFQEAIGDFHADGALQRDPGRRALGLRELLRRFTDVCNAIAYAHSRGILHRDLKPANVMLGPFGETLVVDWGLATTTERRVGRETETQELQNEDRICISTPSGAREQTLPGMPLGTPAFMSPEQACGKIDRVGDRSDVYSLGATFYYLLTGKAPFEGSDLAAILRRVQNGEYPAPRKVDSSIDAALEAICVKAMALEPEDRYHSARELAQDVERWLAGEPVTAWREPFSVQARRWVRRHRTLVSSMTAVLVVGLAGLAAFASILAGKNRELELQRLAAVDERNHARKSESESRAVLEFLEEQVLAATRPEGQAGGLGKEVTIRRALDAAEPKIREAFHHEPGIEASIRNTLGQTYLYLGELPLAIAQLERSVQLRRQTLGRDHPATLDSSGNLAVAYHDAGRLQEAIGLFEETLKCQTLKLGPDHPDTLGCMDNLAGAYQDAGRLNDALPLFQRTLELRKAKLPRDHPNMLICMNNLALAYRDAGRLKDALPLFEETLELRKTKLGAEHPNTLDTQNNLATVYKELGRFDDALRVFEATLEISKAKLGPEHPDTLISMNNLAYIYAKTDRLSDAIPLFEATLKLRKAKLGLLHPNTLNTMNNLAAAYEDAGQLDEALPLFKETLRLRTEKFGPDHPDSLASMTNLGNAYRDFGRLTEALPMLEEALKLSKVKLGTDHFDTLTTMNALGRAYLDAGQLYESRGLLEETLRLRKDVLGSDHPDTLITMNLLTDVLLAAKRWPEAEKAARERLAFREKKLPDDWRRLQTMIQLGCALIGQSKYTEAERYLLPGYEGLKAREANIPVLGRQCLTAAAGRIVSFYEVWGKKGAADQWRAKLKASGSVTTRK
jgi:serine/threonine protein kinase/tetratricopeptide (TPR) repeat protein